MKKTSLLILLLTLYLANPIFAEQVFDVHDGDTFRLVKPQTECIMPRHRIRPHQAIRMSGTDSPEINQPMGPEARNALKGMIEGKEVQLQCPSCSLQRQTCIVFVNEKNINEEMVKQGWAFDSPKYSHGQYAALQAEAEKARRGVWSLENGGQRPWAYRASQKKK